MKLDPDLSRALEMMRSLEKTLEKLPGLDCGACGCPNCRALAEDIVRGHAFPEDCTFLLRERVRELAEEMVDLAKRVPPAIGEQGQRKNENGGGRGDS
jgi:Na+-translocating ferredoxin:NAD+ oxidoreductase RNF subunit RnfB